MACFHPELRRVISLIFQDRLRALSYAEWKYLIRSRGTFSTILSIDNQK
jgi:hypothetical protein